MRISFLGAARTVTGSMHLIEANDKLILLDCGLFQGRREEAAKKNRELRVKPERLHAVVLSHAHIDHSGNIPTLIKGGFRGRIHATRATADLTAIMLRDSARIQVRDLKYLQRKGHKTLEPLYGTEHARVAKRRFRGWDYDQWFDVAPGVRCCFKDAGHIIGSASVHLEIKEPGQTTKRVTFTGDLGRAGLPILRDPDPLPEAEVVITESTYGGRCHGGDKGVAENMKRALKGAVMAAATNGGKLIIPAFSVGRTQNILYFLNELIAERQVPTVRIFIDSPLSVEATEVLRRHPECFDEETRDKLEDNLKPLIGSHVDMTRTVAESKLINRVRGTCVIISASGMCEFGRILHHLKRHLDDPNSVVAFVGYQAHETLGRRLIEGVKNVKIYGDRISVKAQVIKLNGFSAHADHDELLAALSPLRSAAGHTFVVHGDEKPALKFASALTSRSFQSVHVPHEGDEFTI